MKKLYIPYILICIIALSLFFLPLYNKKESNDKKVNENAYTIKATNKKILLYNSKNEIIKELNIDYNSLRNFDKEQFEKGITISESNELNQIIEDFLN